MDLFITLCIIKTLTRLQFSSVYISNTRIHVLHKYYNSKKSYSFVYMSKLKHFSLRKGKFSIETRSVCTNSKNHNSANALFIHIKMAWRVGVLEKSLSVVTLYRY